MGKIIKEEKSDNLFYNELGPVIHYYLSKLDAYINYLDDGKTKFLFLSRAGVRIFKLYEVFKNQRNQEVSPNVSIFWASRFLLCKAYWLSDWKVVGDIVRNEYYNASSKDVIKGIFNSEKNYDSSGLLKLELSQNELLNRIQENDASVKKITEYLKQQSSNFKKYLKSEIGNYDRVVIIDSGWQGTAHSVLSKIHSKKEWISLLFGKITSQNSDSLIQPNVHGLVFESYIEDQFNYFNNQLPATAFTLHRHLIESLFEPNGKSVESIEIKNDKCYSPQADTLLNETPTLDKNPGFLGVLDYLTDNSNLSLIEIQKLYDLNISKLAQKIVYPTKEQLTHLGFLERSKDFGKEDSNNVLLDPEPRFFGDTSKNRIKESLWSHGQMTLEYEVEKAKYLQNKNIKEGPYIKLNEKKAFLKTSYSPSESSKPDVAVITRTKDRPILLERAARSVAGQTYSNYVWVVVNDGGDVEPVIDIIIKSKIDLRKVILVSNPESLGMEAASNKGIQSCDSEFIVIHDDDDSWDAKFLEETVYYLKNKKGSKYGGVVTGTVYVSEEIKKGEVIIHNKQPYNGWLRQIQIMEMCCGNVFAPIAFLFRRDIYNKVSGFDENLPVLGDWDFNLRFLNEADIGVLPEPLAFYHHRDVNNNDLTYSNSVIGGMSKHLEYEPIVRNKFVRMSLEENKLGNLVNLGFIMKTVRGMLQQMSSNADPVPHNKMIDLQMERDYFAKIADITRSKTAGLDKVLTLKNKISRTNSIPEDFDESRYLNANPDVKEAVQKGIYKSGFEHYLTAGMKEGRIRYTSNIRELNQKI